MSNKLRNLADAGAFEKAMREEVTVLYKHSPFCAVSMGVKRQIERFAKRNPEVPVYIVDVVNDRSLSQQIARDLDVRHESPQAILVRSGSPQQHESHYGVTVEKLESWLTEDA